MDVRPIRLVTASALSSLRASAEQAIGQWAERWLGKEAAVHLRCEPLDPHAVECSEGAWLRAGAEQVDAWLPAEALSVLAVALFGTARGETASTVARAAAVDLMARLAGHDATLAPTDAAAPHHLWQPGRGVVAASVEIRGKAQGALIPLLLEVHTPAVVAPSAATAALTNFKAALREQTIDVEVSLGQVEIELGALRGLAVGDVLRLDRALDAGADVRVCGQRVGCVGFLGAHEGRRAVALARV